MIRNLSIKIGLGLMCLGIVVSLALGSDRVKVEDTSIEVVTTIPIETTFGHAGTADAGSTWVEMIDGAKKTVDLAQFYLSTVKNERLEPVISAIIKAAQRGVDVRFLVGKAVNKEMEEKTLEVINRFAKQKKIKVAMFDWKSLTGGIHHAKYFIVDRREIYVGSQNFDWRSLKHIHETGLRIKNLAFAGALTRIFDADWLYNTGDKEAYEKMKKQVPVVFGAGDVLGDYLVASPDAFNPPGIKSALNTLVALIDGAKKKITVQLLSYHVDVYGSAEKFTVIDDALRRAAGRGVLVKMVVADWNMSKPSVDGLKELVKVPNIQVKFATIPAYSGGFIPYARVHHSKVMRVDDGISWVGTSNWGDRYFYQSRNIEIVTMFPPVAKTLDKLFDELWNSDYTYPVDPAKEYVPPRKN